MTEYLKVLFPQQRQVLINDTSRGETNELIDFTEGGEYVVTLADPPDFTPPQQTVDLRNTSMTDPKVIEFEEA